MQTPRAKKLCRGFVFTVVWQISAALSNVLQKILFDEGMKVLQYQTYSSFLVTIIALFFIDYRAPIKVSWKWALLMILFMVAEYMFWNVGLLFMEPGSTTIVWCASSLLVSSVAGHYFMQETLYPVTYSICAFAIVAGLYIASKSPAFTFFGCIFAALSATGSTIFQCLQNFKPQNEYIMTFAYRATIVLLSFPGGVIYDSHFPTSYQWFILTIGALCNLTFMVCWLQVVTVIDIHVVSIVCNIGIPVAYVLQFFLLGVSLTIDEFLGGCLIFIAIVAYPSYKHYQQKRLIIEEEIPLMIEPNDQQKSN